MSRRWSAAMLLLVAGGAMLAPVLAPNAPERRFTDLQYAPPPVVHLFTDREDDALREPRRESASRRPAGPHIHSWRLVDRLERRFEADARPVALRWLREGRLVTSDAEVPLFLLGGDSVGRDVFSRLLYGGRVSLALAFGAALGAVTLGALGGLVLGASRGPAGALLERVVELALVLPSMYVLLVVRGALPLVMPSWQVFVLLAVLLSMLGAPLVARGVRAIAVAERQRDYTLAARALGASSARIAWRHLLPAALPFLRTQFTLLLPAAIVAEATLSFVGFGFPSATVTWGTMLQEAANVSTVADAPWLLASAAAMVVVSICANLLVDTDGPGNAGSEAYGGVFVIGRRTDPSARERA